MYRSYVIGLLFLFAVSLAVAAEFDTLKTVVRVRITNHSGPASYSLSYTRNWLADDKDGFWPQLGYLGKDGLSKEAPAKEKQLGPGENSGWVKLPYFGSVLHICRQGGKPGKTDIEIDLLGNIPGLHLARKIVWEGSEDTLHVYLFHHPVSNGPDVLCLKTFDEMLADNTQSLQQVLQQCPWKKTPRRMVFYSDLPFRPTDSPALVEKQLDFLHAVGVNGLGFFDTTCFPLLDKKGFLYFRPGGAGFDLFANEDHVKVRSKFTAMAMDAVAPYERFGMRDKARNLTLGDEISNGLLADYLAGGEQTRLQLSEYLTAHNIPPTEFGWQQYGQMQLAPPAILKQANPAFYYWANRIRMEQICERWKLAQTANARFFPKAWGSPNWSVCLYLNGGYDQYFYDLWLLYREKALSGCWGEDWCGSLNGFTAFQSDMMRSQAQDLPLGMYAIAESGYSPFEVHFKLYEEMSRGFSEIFWYTYGGLYGNEARPWWISRDVLGEVAVVNREAGEAEPYLLETKLEQPKVALLLTPAQEIWDPTLHPNLSALYYLLLHANYSVDILSSYDVDEGKLARYKVLYMPFEYIEKDTWEKVKRWTEQGGSLVLETGLLHDEYNRPMPLDAWLPGCQSTQVQKDPAPAMIGNNPLLPLIENTKPVAFPVVWSKASLVAPQGAKVLLTYADGQPAACNVAKGAGRVTLYGFHPALSYQWDQVKRDKVSFEHKVFHCFDPRLRAMVVAPMGPAGVSHVAGIADDLVVARHRVGNGKECVVLFDYHAGNAPEIAFSPVWDNVKERRVKVTLDYPVAHARCLRGKIVRREGHTIEVVFRGIDMILVDER